MADPAATRGKSINPHAYNALADALAVIYWNKPPFERYVRSMLRDHPELLSGLDFKGETKRETAGRLVDRLRAHQPKYLDLTVAFMLDVAAFDSFANLRQQTDAQDLIAKAEAAVAELRRWTGRHEELVRERAARAAAIATAAADAGRVRHLASALEDLRQRFLEMHASRDAQRRGTAFEGFINELFALYDLEPRAAYSLAHEQVDGAFSFETDDYILEAKWWREPVGRPLLDIFKSSIERKAKNTLGLYVSINGFTSDALTVYSASTPFITMDGADFMAVLEHRVRLDDLLRRKKRHASETGHCYFPASKLLAH